MRKLYGLLAAAVIIGAAPAGASVLTLGNAAAPNNSFSLAIGALPGIVAPQVPSAVPGILVSSGTGGFTEPAGIFPVNVVLATQLFTGVNLISSLNVSANNATGVFAAGAGLNGGFGGVKPLTGNAVVGVLGGLINLTIPLNTVGAGGVVQTGAAALMVTVTGTIWTTGVAQVTGITTTTENGAVLNTLTLTGYDNRTAGHKGTLMLVSPTRILTNAAGNLPAFATQILEFVPEPGTLLLLGSGVVGLGLIGRKRLRK